MESDGTEKKIRLKEKRKETMRVVKFVLFSVSAGVIEIVSFSLLNVLTGWDYWPCYLIALVLSVLWICLFFINSIFNEKPGISETSIFFLMIVRSPCRIPCSSKNYIAFI